MNEKTAGVEAYPLHWPLNKPRTQGYRRENSRFETSFTRARDQLINEVKLMGGKSLVISTNINLRRDGLPLAGQRAPEDPGVAIYFTDKSGKQKCIACDRWRKVEDNLWAVAKAIDALRGIQRWGTGDMVEAAFAGFTALPAVPKKQQWFEVLEVSRRADASAVQAQYRSLALRHHPDRGGSHQKMAELNAALDEFKRERGVS